MFLSTNIPVIIHWIERENVRNQKYINKTCYKTWMLEWIHLRLTSCQKCSYLCCWWSKLLILPEPYVEIRLGKSVEVQVHSLLPQSRMTDVQTNAITVDMGSQSYTGLTTGHVPVTLLSQRSEVVRLLWHNASSKVNTIGGIVMVCFSIMPECLRIFANWYQLKTIKWKHQQDDMKMKDINL